MHRCTSCGRTVVETKAFADNISEKRNAGYVLEAVDVQMLLIFCKRLNFIGKIYIADNIEKTFAVVFSKFICFAIVIIKFSQL